MIEVRSLTKWYGKVRAVDGLSFTVPDGYVTGFLGPNGAGKSTTMRLILGLDTPTSGESIVNGRRYTRIRGPLHEVGTVLDARAVRPGLRAVRTGIRTVLTSAADIEVVAEAEDGRAAVEAGRRHRPDIELLDIRMPVLDGLGALEQFRQLLPATRVVMLTTFGYDDYISRALRSGASGFILKDSAPDELIGAVRSVARGHAYLSPKVTRQVVNRFRNHTRADADPAAAARVASLTDRERDVLTLLAEGLPNATIAQRLHMTEATIRTYVSRILAKLDCENRVQAAILALQTGLLHPEDSSGS